MAPVGKMSDELFRLVHIKPCDKYIILTVRYQGIEPIQARQLKIGEYCDPKPAVPECMLPIEPQTSRMLDLLEKKHSERQQRQTNAISFSNFRKDIPKEGE